MLTRFIALSLGIVCSLGASVATSAEGPTAPFTAEQASAGQQLYAQRCGGCHAPDLSQAGHGPALTGDQFWANWNGKPARELYGRIISTMPSGEPGTLSPRQVLALVAFILSSNGYAPADTALEKPDQLDAVQISKAHVSADRG